MDPQTIVLSVKLTKTEANLIDKLVMTQNYESRSGVIRAGLGLVFQKYPFCRQQDLQIERERRIVGTRINRNLKHRPRPVVVVAKKSRKPGRSR